MRLRAANVRTLGDLAAMTPESLADVLNVSPERVIRDDLLGQARRLLGLE
jgi:predicted flap endonuclease-1-like 5' DNA nuclease